MLGVAVADMSCPSAPTSGNKRPVEGRFLFEESMQMVIYRTAVDINGGTGDACIEVESSSPIFWLQFERWQNVDVRIDDYTEMPGVIERAAALDPMDCRRYVEERFSSERMVRDYEAAYEKALEGAAAAA